MSSDSEESFENPILAKLRDCVLAKRSGEKLRLISRRELKARSCPDSPPLWLCIHGMVFDVTPLVDGGKKHPGGPERIVDATRMSPEEATRAFTMHHYPWGRAVKSWAPDMYVGDYCADDAKIEAAKQADASGETGMESVD
eukprot:TRINITY_DN16369_c0_g1_i2.p1 TRINITY_DN16369_c0_g1~~TRINITY_DN16369_c0_g1_i2.p1  ORF type:complete len:141 (+),score=17.25 TRINITY_DN16369_c0_g1_i2:61-483(+)